MTHSELKEAIKIAMKARDSVRLGVLRGLSAAAVNELVAKGKKPDGELSQDDILGLVMRAAKQRKDSIEQFEKGGRADLAAKEKEELAVLTILLPAQLSREEIEKAAKEKASALGITDKSKANQLMGMLMKDLKGKANGTLVKEVVDTLFT